MPDESNVRLPHCLPVNMYHAFQTESCVTNGSAQLDENGDRLFFISQHPQNLLPVSPVDHILVKSAASVTKLRRGPRSGY